MVALAIADAAAVPDEDEAACEALCDGVDCTLTPASPQAESMTVTPTAKVRRCMRGLNGWRLRAQCGSPQNAEAAAITTRLPTPLARVADYLPGFAGLIAAMSQKRAFTLATAASPLGPARHRPLRRR